MYDEEEIELFVPTTKQVPEDIRKLMSKGESALEKILDKEMTFRLFRSSEPTIVKYFVDNSDKLLELAFDKSESKNELGAKAFAILEHSQADLTRAILSHQSLHRHAVDTIQDTVVSQNLLFINRLTSLTLAVFYFDPVAATRSCGYLMQLLSLLSEPTVLSLFETLCSGNFENREVVQGWLIEMGFPEIIYNEIDSCQPNTDCTHYSKEANYIYSLFRIVCFCGTSPILGPKFCTPNFVKALNLNVGGFSEFIEYQRWETLTALYCEKTKESMRGLFPIATEIIRDEHLIKTRAGVAALELLSLMLNFDGDVFTSFFLTMDISNVIINAIISNSSHTHLHFAALEYFRYAFMNQQLMSELWKTIPEIIMNNFKENNHCLRCVMYKLFKLFLKAAKSKTKIIQNVRSDKTVENFLRGPFTKYREIKNRYYGDFAVFTHDNAKEMAQQIIQNMGL
ncbi:hypothetical protein GPJ56_002846 [Histomonas meleagridis]|uniref:uncharacterized protein n=1 Tax=Histomonas meleagridis TaxID=135588 RepID=UPI0035593A47|nr:hypothetical protein GPJ56_002846 [Histomonas meleagridis]KAH0806362.1 hypothetical protein GO595_001050 [Histomonas meleagridis]